MRGMNPIGAKTYAKDGNAKQPDSISLNLKMRYTISR